MQRMRTAFEIVVGEDASTDRTRQIAQHYAEQHPDVVRVLAHDQNLGMHRNWVATMAACRGRYIAWLDADDYWTDPDKLQRQSDFLDQHADYSMVFHDALLLYENGGTGPRSYCRIGNSKPPATCTLEHLLTGNFVPTSAVLFRAGLIGEVPGWIYDLNWIDWPFHLLHAMRGKVGYIDEQMSIYRVHGGGMWSSLPRAARLREIIEFYSRIYDWIPPLPRRVVDQRRAKAYLELSRLSSQSGDPRASLSCLAHAARGYAVCGQAPLLELAIAAAGVGKLGLRRAFAVASKALTGRPR
jgi:glycosyltransferase involved in cell wall biosynthesis